VQVLKEEFGDVARFTAIQGESIDIIEKNTTCAEHHAEEGVVDLRKAERMSKCCGCCPFC